MKTQYIIDHQTNILIEGQTQPQVQVLYQPIPQNQLQQQYQIIPQYQQQNLLYLGQGAQQNPKEIIINDSNFCSNMCCTLTWFIFALIFSIGNFLFLFLLHWFYLLLNIIFMLAAILIIIAICLRNTKLYKAGYIFYYIYVILYAFSNIVIDIFIWSFPDALDFLGITLIVKEQEKSDIEKSLMIYKIIFTVSIFIQICFSTSILGCLERKIKVFQAYENYAQMEQNLLNQQTKIVN